VGGIIRGAWEFGHPDGESTGGTAIESAGIAKPARIYDLRSTFASNALAAGITVYELAWIMGTSVSMTRRTTGR
jgi:hypothetical protein